MIVYLKKRKLRKIMERNSIKNYQQLAYYSGANYNSLMCALSRKRAPQKLCWLLADFLECDINELVSVDWSDGK